MRGLDNSAYVQQLYLRVLGRVADPDGWKSYVEKLEASLPRGRFTSPWPIVKRCAIRQSPCCPAATAVCGTDLNAYRSVDLHRH
ncbi:DUF4214 domain-containing protein [Candidatus Aalborgicola defluviihabitans]|uniref:DUF4214 domain-containing protein n=1 Tax=Candidatus Aalborgicola defluviihabitans TaxID=3386187 RepID=UPI001ED35503|nr:DUF4214 domain-containing protein [Burkholderiales bacterium]